MNKIRLYLSGAAFLLFPIELKCHMDIILSIDF